MGADKPQQQLSPFLDLRSAGKKGGARSHSTLAAAWPMTLFCTYADLCKEDLRKMWQSVQNAICLSFCPSGHSGGVITAQLYREVLLLPWVWDWVDKIWAASIVKEAPSTRKIMLGDGGDFAFISGTSVASCTPLGTFSFPKKEVHFCTYEERETWT